MVKLVGEISAVTKVTVKSPPFGIYSFTRLPEGEKRNEHLDSLRCYLR
jgi:hypothetical protein